MPPSDPAALRRGLAPYRDTLYRDLARGERAGVGCFAPDASVRLCHPFGDLTGWDGLWETALGPLAAAMPDGERRDQIVVAGTDGEGAAWIGCAGLYLGTLTTPFLDIPPTRRLVHMRYHEFFRIEAGQVVEMQAIWDLP